MTSASSFSASATSETMEVASLLLEYDPANPGYTQGPAENEERFFSKGGPNEKKNEILSFSKKIYYLNKSPILRSSRPLACLLEQKSIFYSRFAFTYIFTYNIFLPPTPLIIWDYPFFTHCTLAYSYRMNLSKIKLNEKTLKNALSSFSIPITFSILTRY